MQHRREGGWGERGLGGGWAGASSTLNMGGALTCVQVRDPSIVATDAPGDRRSRITALGTAACRRHASRVVRLLLHPAHLRPGTQRL